MLLEVIVSILVQLVPRVEVAVILLICGVPVLVNKWHRLGVVPGFTFFVKLAILLIVVVDLNFASCASPIYEVAGRVT